MENNNNGGFTDTFFNKLKEQSFTIILLVGILWYQNNTYKTNLSEYEDMIKDKDAIILKQTNDERQRLIDRISYLQDQRDKYVEELIETK
jgi:uncharacterized protein YaaQ